MYLEYYLLLLFEPIKTKKALSGTDRALYKALLLL